MRRNTEADFWAYVEIGDEDDCWLWTKFRNRGGYGRFKLGVRGYMAHRLAWIYTYGPVPTGKMVMHLCDVRYEPGDTSYRACCNPRHLQIGTHAQNMAHRNNTGRVASGARISTALHAQHTTRGAGHYRARLTEDDVRTIRAMYASGAYSWVSLARRFNVAKPTIYHILKGHTWKHVT